MKMGISEKKLTIINDLGLHTRAATKLVKLAQKFHCEIFVAHNGIEANGKSILGLLALGASYGKEIRVRTDGEDHAQALEAIVALVSSGFDEGEFE